jgi:hypothetical protein
MKEPGKTDEILRRKAASVQPSVVRRIDPATGEVIERILPPSQPDPRPGRRGTTCRLAPLPDLPRHGPARRTRVRPDR